MIALAAIFLNMHALVIMTIEVISGDFKLLEMITLSQRVDTARSSRELYELGNVLNQTFSGLEGGIRQRERFTADASHELRTPLTVVLGQIQRLLTKERSEAEQKEGLAVAEKAAQRMKKLVEELMVLARLDAEQKLRRDPLDLATLAQGVISEMRGLLAKHDVTIKTDFSSTPFHGDRNAIVRVLTNLLGNAIQHNTLGVNIEIRTWIENSFVCASVKDDGQGICDEHKPHIFDRFYRADVSRVSQPGSSSSGLGLAICKLIVEQHGGQIVLQSKPDFGSLFTIRLPR